MSVAVVRERFIDLLLAYSEAEKSSDVTKHILSERIDFSPQIAFHFLGPLTPYITSNDIKTFSKENRPL